MSAAISGLRALSSSRNRNRIWVRLVREVSRQPGKAAAAASITARASSTLARASVPVTSPVAGLVMGAVLVPVPANGLPSDQ
jgi:polyribonucleotide nucleotidyltransferase